MSEHEHPHLSPRVQAEITADLERVSTALAEAREDLSVMEERAKVMEARIDERGRRKELRDIQALGHRAMLGCQEARKTIEEAAARHQARIERLGAAYGQGQEPAALVLADPPAKGPDVYSALVEARRPLPTIVLGNPVDDELGDPVAPGTESLLDAVDGRDIRPWENDDIGPGGG